MTNERKKPTRLLIRGLEFFVALVITFVIIITIHALTRPDDATPSQGTREEAAALPDPSQRHASLKNLMLRLTNERRQEAGVPPVTLGTNPAAQLHAEQSLYSCYFSHWDQWGLTPNQRYTLTGGAGSGGENIRGSSHCKQPAPDQPTLGSMRLQVEHSVHSWMDSPGHRSTIMDPANTVLNVGIAHDRHNLVMVQQFGSDYVTYSTRPIIDSRGFLHLSGAVQDATLDIGNVSRLQIAYEPPPQPLTGGQLALTYALCKPRMIAFVVEPLPPGLAYQGPARKTRVHQQQCIDPRKIDAGVQSPGSPRAAREAWQTAKQNSSFFTRENITVTRIIPEFGDLSGPVFDVSANISRLLQEFGPGIYTVILWGRPFHMEHPVPLSQQAIFWSADPPADTPYRPTHQSSLPRRGSLPPQESPATAVRRDQP